MLPVAAISDPLKPYFSVRQRDLGRMMYAQALVDCIDVSRERIAAACGERGEHIVDLMLYRIPELFQALCTCSQPGDYCAHIWATLLKVDDMVAMDAASLQDGWGEDSDGDEFHAEEPLGDASRSQMPRGHSLTECEECGEPIPEARRVAVPGVRRCVRCQQSVEAARPPVAAINRRGSKDSQLR